MNDWWTIHVDLCEHNYFEAYLLIIYDFNTKKHFFIIERNIETSASNSKSFIKK